MVLLFLLADALGRAEPVLSVLCKQPDVAIGSPLHVLRDETRAAMAMWKTWIDEDSPW